MLATLVAFAGSALGLVAGVRVERHRPRFSRCCGTTLGCISCGTGGEVARAAARSRRP